MQGEVDPGDEHEDGDYSFDVGAVEMSHRGVLRRKPPRGDGGEAVVQGIEELYAPGGQKGRFQCG